MRGSWAPYVALVSVCFRLNVANVVTRGGNETGSCIESIYVEKDPLVIDLAEHAGCSLKLATKLDAILAFQLLEGPLSILNDGRVKIRERIGLDQSRYLSLESSEEKDVWSNNLNRMKRKTVYSFGASVTLEISEDLSRGEAARMRIQEAVECPFNIGTETQCGRVFDEVSCYCAAFTPRSWYDQRNFCETYGYKLLSLETKAEEDSIYEAWGKNTYYWTSLNQLSVNGRWIWDSTATRLYPGYANWNTGQPDGAYTGGEQCMHLNFGGAQWNNAGCYGQFAAICEKHS